MFRFLIFVFIFMVSCAPPDLDPIPSPYGQYSIEDLNYFRNIGFCSEFETCDRPVVKKWVSSIRIQMHGSYNEADEEELNKIIVELSELTGLSIKRVKSNANINIYIVPQSDFKKYIPSYSENNPQEGKFSISYNNDYIYYKGVICVKSNANQRKKHHLLREELTQSMGVTDDSYDYSESVFQQDPSYMPTEYLHIDKQVIRILYDKRVKPGMTEEEVKTALLSSPSNTIAST